MVTDKSLGRHLVVDDLQGKRHIVSKANEIIDGKYEYYNLHQIKLFNLFISQINEYTKSTDTWTFKATQLLALLGLDESSYSRLRSATKGMIRGIEIPKDCAKGVSYEQIPLFTKFTYTRGANVVVQIHPDALPFLVAWKKDFESTTLTSDCKPYTSYYYDSIKPLTSVPAIILYEMCRKYLNICKKRRFQEFDIASLRKKLLVKNGKYESFGDLNRYVIKKSVEEINANTDIEIIVHLQKHPSTPKIISVRFEINKTKANKHLLLGQPTEKDITALHSGLAIFISKYGVSKKALLNIQSSISNSPHSDLQLTIAIKMSQKQLDERKDISNMGGYANTVLKSNVALVVSKKLAEKILTEEKATLALKEKKALDKKEKATKKKIEQVKNDKDNELDKLFEEFKLSGIIEECIAEMDLPSVLLFIDSVVYASANTSAQKLYGKPFNELNSEDVFSILTADLSKKSLLKRVQIKNIQNQLKLSFAEQGYL